MSEGVKPDREGATVSQGNSAILNLPDLNTLSVNELFAMIGLEQQPITGRDFQLAGLAHIEGSGGTGRDKIHFPPVRAANTQTVLNRGHHFHSVAPLEMFGLANKSQSLARFVLAHVFPLRFRP